MPCDPFEMTLPDGSVARGFICHRGRRAKAKPCAGCGQPAGLLCDAPTGRGKATCDEPICAACALHDGPDLDFCPAHVPAVGFLARDRAEWDEYFTERAAILEYSGGVADRREAEQLARRLAGPRPPHPIKPPPWFRAEVAREHRQTGKFAGPSRPAAISPAPSLGAGTCRSCGKSILFASTTAGKVGPFESDAGGEWTIAGGVASHAGNQLDLLGGLTTVPRFTSHFATCPQADRWRAR